MFIYYYTSLYIIRNKYCYYTSSRIIRNILSCIREILVVVIQESIYNDNKHFNYTCIV